MHLITNGGSVHFAAGTVTATRHTVAPEDLAPVIVYLDCTVGHQRQYVSISGKPGDIQDFAAALLAACDEAASELLRSIAYKESLNELEAAE
jgi:O-acetyl-ADP-ribose deacetylase (regulator of RNase III)